MSSAGNISSRIAARPGGRSRRVSPVRSRAVALPAVLLVIVALLFIYSMMRLEIHRRTLSDRILAQQARVEQLRGQIASLNAELASSTALSSMRQRALEAGMVEPDPENQPRPLAVVLRPDEVDRLRAARSLALPHGMSLTGGMP